MKTEALLKLNIHITGKEVILLEKLANFFMTVSEKDTVRAYDSDLFAFANEIKSQIANCLSDLDMEVQDA